MSASRSSPGRRGPPARRGRVARSGATRSRRRTRADAHVRTGSWLAQRPQPVAELGGIQLRLLPGGEVTAAVNLVEVDEVGIRRLRPAPGSLVELVRENAYGHRNGDVADVGEAAVPQVLPERLR